MSYFNSISRILYSAARLSRDANAVSRGPKAVAKRSVNKVVYRKSNQLVSKALRSLWKGF